MKHGVTDHDNGNTSTRRIFDTMLIVLLVISFGLRLTVFSSFPIANDETGVAFLIGDHIARHNERIMTGSQNDALEPMRNHPLYYYVVAVLVGVYDDIRVLQVVNIFLQTAFIALVYLLMLLISDRASAFISALLVSISYVHMEASGTMWQPYLMLPILLAAFVLVAYGRRTKNLGLIAASGVVFALSGAIHMSAFFLTPLYFACLWFIAFREVRARRFFLYPMALFLILIAVLYVPLMSFNLKHFPLRENRASGTATQSHPLVRRITANTGVFFDRLFFTSDTAITPLSLAGLPVIAALLCLSLMSRKNKSIRLSFILLGLAVILPLIATSITVPTPKPYRLLLSYFSFLMLISLAATSVFRDYRMPKMMMAAVLLLLSVLVSDGFAFFRPTPVPRDISNRYGRSVLAIADAITGEIHSVMQTRSIESPAFFDLAFYQDKKDKERNNALWWSPLERQFNRPLTRIIDGGRGYETTNTDDVLFVICFTYDIPVSDDPWCNTVAAKNHPGHTITKTLPSPDPAFTVLMAEKGVKPSLVRGDSR